MLNSRKACVAVVLGVMGVVGSMAHAEAERPRHHHGSTVITIGSSSYGHRSAGTLWIDGRRFVISSRRSISRQICDAFWRCGYDAEYRRGKLIVCTDRYRTPRVRWSAGSYCLEICREHGELIMSWSRVRDHGVSWRFDSRDHWGGRRGWDHRRPSRRWSCD